MNYTARIPLLLNPDTVAFMRAENCHGTLADTLEAIFCERASLLKDLSAISNTSNQLGLEAVPFMGPRFVPYNMICELSLASNQHQANRLRQCFQGYKTHSIAVEHTVNHLRYLRKVTDDARLECARAMLSRRVALRFAS